jgi:hypothetical protein
MGAGARAKAELLSAHDGREDHDPQPARRGGGHALDRRSLRPILAVESLTEAEVLRRLTLEVDELCQAMGTLDAEIEELAE